MNIINEVETSTLETFEKIKKRTEKKWALMHPLWVGQIQNDSKWKPGLTDEELKSFENEIGFKFPNSLKNFYKTMNGLDKSGITLTGNIADAYPVFYSYPEDLEIIRSQINWILDGNEISLSDIKNGKAPFIFPYFGHRFLVFDDNEQVLSICGKDIIIWADNLAKAIVKDVFHLDRNQIKNTYKPVTFWMENLDD